jgi:hypothetical protein
VFSIIAGSTNWVSDNLGCNGKMKGILEVWQGIDSYIHQVDSALCSTACPCYITNTTGYTSNQQILPYYENWIKTTSTSGARNFQDCDPNVQQDAYRQVVSVEGQTFDPTHNFIPNKFYLYMAHLEESLECTGWCNVSYPSALGEVTQYKYLFSNVNRGPAKYVGCLNRLIDWLPPLLLAFGSVNLLSACFQIVVFILTLWHNIVIEKDIQIPNKKMHE